ncbi:hypothetical protein Nepgr_005465 [Nepenthes gracilis]|uniref:Uncharacterized protein n=1 Tax=Nepenthes gracilis TaxID=150966 RepID=A0AAD3S3D5_NEPGR|nr:hypothetical protein Nepgr_005465 [Nepenthes gracilis]
MTKPYKVGQFVRLKADVLMPRFKWPCERGGEWATGRITQIHANGCLIVKFPVRFVFGNELGTSLADPAQVSSVGAKPKMGRKNSVHPSNLHSDNKSR